MKKTDSLAALAIALLFGASASQPASGADLWTATQGIDAPESAYFEPVTGYIFVSNVAGKPDEKDGKGWISKLDADGTVLAEKWVSGFNAPKGLRAAGGILWVGDIDE